MYSVKRMPLTAITYNWSTDSLLTHWTSAKGSQYCYEAARTGEGKHGFRKAFSPSIHTCLWKTASSNPNPKEVSLATCLHPACTALAQHTLPCISKVTIKVRENTDQKRHHRSLLAKISDLKEHHFLPLETKFNKFLWREVYLSSSGTKIYTV